MGLFKDMKNLKKQADQIQQQTGYQRPSLREGLAQANEVLGQVNAGIEQSQRLQAEGAPATATITAVRDTGMLMNQFPVLEFDLQVAVGSEPPAAVTTQQATPHTALGRAIPGGQVAALVDRNDFSQILLQWEAALPQA